MTHSLRFMLTALVGVALCATANSAFGNLLTNSDFETGTLAGWTNQANATIASGGPEIAGSFSATVPADGSSHDFGMHQEFTFPGSGLTEPNTTTFLFSMPDPGGAGDRGLNVLFWKSNLSRLNLRVVDTDNNGIGDVQMHQATSGNDIWVSIPELADVVNFNVINSLTLEIFDFAPNLNYSLTVNNTTASNLNWSHVNNVPFDEYNRIAFVGRSSQVGYTVDNVSVTVNPIVPEPRTMLLGTIGAVGLIGFGLRGRRRRRLLEGALA